MKYTSAYGLGPSKTPSAIKWLIICTCACSLLTALINPLFVEFLNIQGPNFLLSLSFYGLKNGYLWQPLTYLFVEEGIQGVSFGLLITLFFQMYILWIFGSQLSERVGGYSFALFYLFCGALSGMITILSAPAFGQSPFLVGPAAALTSLWVVWTMIHPESDLLFFFLIPIKAKWLLAGGISAFFLVNLSQGNFSNVIFYLSGLLSGYFYGLIAWDLEGPFLWTKSVDEFLKKTSAKLFKRKTENSLICNSKIIDIHTGSPLLDDEAFVDSMVEKISQKGEHSLTWSERRRLKKISNKNR